MSKIILAFSGGLDTSVSVPILKEKYEYDEVIAATVDVGQPKQGIKEAKKSAKEIGIEHHVIDAKEEFIEDYIYELIKANGEYEGYLLGHAIARPLIAKKICELSDQKNADAVAHGCTGKGNDQFRFEATFRSECPERDIVAPIRELNLTREEEKEYAREKGIKIGSEEEKWSIDENLWSRSIEGSKLEDPNYQPPEEIYSWTQNPEKAPNEPEYLEIDFKEGIPYKIDGKKYKPIKLVSKLNEKVGRHGVGRVDMIEDRILGLKARENYEHPAATALLEAHRDLENLVLSRKEIKFKRIVENEWSELVYNGLLNEPLFEDLNEFIQKTQGKVNGKVKLKLYKGGIKVVSRKSKDALYSEDLVSFDDKTLDQRDSKGAVKYHGLQSRLE
ncbi:MAG: Argininosuccinate synthase ArgG [Candidatus Methanohalarchaeum thermophilum]|uniref:Argininosuccinate synthase n=1 Tax=Methanohalarchaeum thermophilum TaxID=1903181 RepID=A0A1Q6DXB9_METT1|nr:MAG: Argininosuccinate synthase ArgG [Candidatus Methanohalarchaeum thermophilum]